MTDAVPRTEVPEPEPTVAVAELAIVDELAGSELMAAEQASR